MAEHTLREREILRRIADGETNVAIAQALGVSYETVKTYVCRIRAKAEVGACGPRRKDLVAYAKRWLEA